MCLHARGERETKSARNKDTDYRPPVRQNAQPTPSHFVQRKREKGKKGSNAGVNSESVMADKMQVFLFLFFVVTARRGNGGIKKWVGLMAH